MAIERIIGGLGCGEVLERLSDYLDGELTAEVKSAVEAHIAECDRCAQFGVAFTTVIRNLKAGLGTPSGPRGPT